MRWLGRRQRYERSTKRGKLTNTEWAEIKKHPEVGYRITQTVPELRNISCVITRDEMEKVIHRD